MLTLYKVIYSKNKTKGEKKMTDDQIKNNPLFPGVYEALVNKRNRYTLADYISVRYSLSNSDFAIASRCIAGTGTKT